MNDDDALYDVKLIAKYKLLPCPFCGSTNTAVLGTYSAYGICRDCDSSTGFHRGQAKAAEAWNRRAK
jgi:Lar family restriction alleviation protein